MDRCRLLWSVCHLFPSPRPAMLQPTPVPSASNASTHSRPLGQQCFNPLPSPRPAMLQPTPVSSASNASTHSRPLGQQCFNPFPSPRPAMLQPTPVPSASNASTHSRPLGQQCFNPFPIPRQQCSNQSMPKPPCTSRLSIVCSKNMAAYSTLTNILFVPCTRT